jgi:hypothetical protein
VRGHYIVTVVLRIKRTSGWTETHELPSEGDYVFVPPELLGSGDVVGFDVEIADPDRPEPAGAPEKLD